MRIREDYRSLTGPEKAAILMLSLTDDQVARLFEFMDDEEIKQISQTMANLGSVSSNLVERLFIEFAEEFSQGSALVGSMESTERLLSKVLGKERLVDIMDDIRGPAGRTTWDKLGHVSEQVLANYLKNEYPQTIAVVLSKIRPEQAARVLAELPDTLAMEVVMRMLRMEPVQKEVLDHIETTLRTEFMNTIGKTSRRDPHGMMAEIFNALDRGTEARFLSSLEERNREAAERIRALMFTFEDLLRLDTPGLQTLMRAVDKGKLAVALKGASEVLRDSFLNGMSDRAAKLMREDMAAMGPVRLRDVDDAQNELVQLAKDLAARGEINLHEGGGDELVY